MATGKGTLTKLTTAIRVETLMLLKDKETIRICDCESQNQLIRLILEKGLEDLQGTNRLYMNRSKAIETEGSRGFKN